MHANVLRKEVNLSYPFWVSDLPRLTPFVREPVVSCPPTNHTTYPFLPVQTVTLILDKVSRLYEWHLILPVITVYLARGRLQNRACRFSRSRFLRRRACERLILRPRGTKKACTWTFWVPQYRGPVIIHRPIYPSEVTINGHSEGVRASGRQTVLGFLHRAPCFPKQALSGIDALAG